MTFFDAIKFWVAKPLAELGLTAIILFVIFILVVAFGLIEDYKTRRKMRESLRKNKQV